MNVRTGLVGGLAVVLGGLSLACGTSGPSSTGGGTKDQPINAAASTGGPASVKPRTDGITGDGTFAVGSQVKPGTYRAVVPGDSFGCYWARLKAADGSIDSIIANGNGDPGQQMIVTVKAADKWFETKGCGSWSRVG